MKEGKIVAGQRGAMELEGESPHSLHAFPHT